MEPGNRRPTSVCDVDLEAMGEFGFLDRVAGWVSRGGADVGIGDDAAVVSVGSTRLAITTDAIVEGAHFRLDWSSPGDIGWKAVAVNASDLAAMGAEPRWCVVTLAAPSDTDADVLRGVYEGLEDACQDSGLELVGGDTVRSDVLLLSVTAVGELDGEPMLRSTARPGDVLAVTGRLGRAAAGVNLLLSQDPTGLAPEDAIACMDAHRRPRARVAEGLALRRSGVRCAMDLSDGLLSDLRRLAEASGVGVEVDVASVPVAPEARAVADAKGWDVERIALAGGEDLELLIAHPDAPAGTHTIGRVVDDGLWLVRGGQREPLPEGGWDHFSRPR